jgi:hypothetical protein
MKLLNNLAPRRPLNPPPIPAELLMRSDLATCPEDAFELACEEIELEEQEAERDASNRN